MPRPPARASADRRPRAGGDDHCHSDNEHEKNEARNRGRQRGRGKQRVNPAAERRPQRRGRGLQANQRQEQPGQPDENGDSQERCWDREHGGSSNQRPSGDAERKPPAIETTGRWRTPQAIRFPEPDATIDGREKGPNRTDATTRRQIDLDAGFVEGTQHAGMVGASGTRTGQHDRCAEPRRILPVRGVRRDHNYSERIRLRRRSSGA